MDCPVGGEDSFGDDVGDWVGPYVEDVNVGLVELFVIRLLERGTLSAEDVEGGCGR